MHFAILRGKKMARFILVVMKLLLTGNTGYPFIDAGVRQLLKEGWTHHIVRNALSMFLTR